MKEIKQPAVASSVSPWLAAPCGGATILYTPADICLGVTAVREAGTHHEAMAQDVAEKRRRGVILLSPGVVKRLFATH